MMQQPICEKQPGLVLAWLTVCVSGMGGIPPSHGLAFESGQSRCCRPWGRWLIESGRNPLPRYLGIR
ncbi:hypothetical protein HNQ59_000146 [Chitinivorax tropicus]|uniref:Uncharacterized protein n=1 Tax=Chitinivorax tropicus TaxID=714531 RepID=A0A840MC33_9PROT|nr:hypothetical protein [Chitinivorax tropicus]